MNVTTILTYGLLLLSVIALWIKSKIFGRIYLWQILLSIAFVFALIFKYASIFSLFYSLVLGIVTFQYFRTKNIVYFLLVIVLVIPLYYHFPIVEFNNFRYKDNVKITDIAYPYSLYFNFDKTLIGLFIFGFGCQLNRGGFGSLFGYVFKYLVFIVSVILVLTLLLGYSKFEPKIPNFTIIWMLVNLFFVCVAEEALFRSLIQDKLESLFSFKGGYLLSVFGSSLLFGLSHFKGGIPYIALSTVAGLFYGHIYYKTKRIESAILLHFTFNLTHFLLFTYPALEG